MVAGPSPPPSRHVCRMNLTSSRQLTWGRFLNKFRSIPASLWPEDPSTGLIIMPCGQIMQCGLLTNFCPRFILTFSKTSRIRTGFLTEQFWQAEMMWLSS
ncbi:hypothetical protein TNCT_547971 [Trichonephila clavata]|uniref:Uncharacterized protein n=1 Tax=Trichonephila clavata TaxID=2740835 RepID=A0A8X6LC15_TRICU|nr:hypothetical protein TNCT_547971 [Trichonephila clavata]